MELGKRKKKKPVSNSSTKRSGRDGVLMKMKSEKTGEAFSMKRTEKAGKKKKTPWLTGTRAAVV